MKKWIVCVLTLCMLAVFAGALAEFPVTLVDQAGREVSISEQPERIVSGYYISTSACIALGLEDCMVGVEAKADTRNIYTLAAPSLLELPSVGTAKAFDLEACLATEPDLVILPVRLADSADALAEFGIPVLLVSPEDDELLLEMIALIGEATGEDAGAQRVYCCPEGAMCPDAFRRGAGDGADARQLRLPHLCAGGYVPVCRARGGGGCQRGGRTDGRKLGDARL